MDSIVPSVKTDL